MICVYFLQCGRKSYIGYTVNIVRRLRQHRGEIVGGARCTSKFKQVDIVAHISGFPDKRTAMSYEWYAKHKLRGGTSPVKLPKDNNEQVHCRFSQYLSRIKHKKFKSILATLTLTLYKHHSLADTIKSEYGFENVVCQKPM